MPCNSYSQFLSQLLQSMLQENENYRPKFSHILQKIRPYIQQTYFQEELLKDIPQQVPPMILQNTPLRLNKNLSNVQLLQKTIMRSESKAIMNDSYKQNERSPINNSAKIAIQAKPQFVQSFQGSGYSTDIKNQSYMKIPSQLSPMTNQQQQYFQSVHPTRSIHNSKIIQKENQFGQKQQNNTSFYGSPIQQTFTSTTPISPISKATQKIILTPLSRSNMQQQSVQYQNELNISDQMFFSPTIPKQIRVIKQSPYLNQQVKQVSPNLLQSKQMVRKISQQHQRSITEQFFDQTKEENSSKNLNTELISNNEKKSNDDDRASNFEKSSKGSKNEKDSNNNEQKSEKDESNFAKVDINAKNINLRTQTFEKITEVSKEIENNTEIEKKSQESQQLQNFDQDASQEWQLVDNQEEEEVEEPNYIEIIEEKIKKALRNSQQTISQVQGQQAQIQNQVNQEVQYQHLQQQQQVAQIQFKKKPIQPIQCQQYAQQQTPIAYGQSPMQKFPIAAPSPNQYFRTHSPTNINICFRPQQVIQFYPQNQQFIYLF